MQIPNAAGKKDILFKCSDCSIDGRIRLHILAASIIPPEKPSIILLIFGLILFLIKNAEQAPKDVPTNGIRIDKTVLNIKNHL